MARSDIEALGPSILFDPFAFLV